MSSPKNSTRSGCSSVGGNTSTMPPRTANSPRFSTRSTREYAASDSRRTTSSRSALSPTAQLDRLEVGQPLHLRLQHRADRRHHHVERAVALVGARVAQPAQHGEPAPDGVAAGAEPFVRQRLPRRVVADPGGVEHVTEHLDQVLGLARGRGDHQHGAPGVDQALDHERAQRGRTGQVERREPAAVGHRLGKDGVAQDEVSQAGDAQRVLLETGWGHTTNAPSRRGQGGGEPRPVYEAAGLAADRSPALSPPSWPGSPPRCAARRTRCPPGRPW